MDLLQVETSTFMHGLFVSRIVRIGEMERIADLIARFWKQRQPMNEFARC